MNLKIFSLSLLFLFGFMCCNQKKQTENSLEDKMFSIYQTAQTSEDITNDYLAKLDSFPETIEFGTDSSVFTFRWELDAKNVFLTDRLPRDLTPGDIAWPTNFLKEYLIWDTISGEFCGQISFPLGFNWTPGCKIEITGLWKKLEGNTMHKKMLYAATAYTWEPRVIECGSVLVGTSRVSKKELDYVKPYAPFFSENYALSVLDVEYSSIDLMEQLMVTDPCSDMTLVVTLISNRPQWQFDTAEKLAKKLPAGEINPTVKASGIFCSSYEIPSVENDVANHVLKITQRDGYVVIVNYGKKEITSNGRDLNELYKYLPFVYKTLELYLDDPWLDPSISVKSLKNY